MNPEFGRRAELVWTPDNFKSYIKNLAGAPRSDKLCFSSESSPDFIDQGPVLNGAMDYMRNLSQRSGEECVTIVGVRQEDGAVVIGTEIEAKGEKKQILGGLFTLHRPDPAYMALLYERAYKKGIKPVAMSHSHPHMPRGLNSFFKTNEFSTVDLFNLISEQIRDPLIFLAGPDRNSLVCRTSETPHVPRETSVWDFYNKWNKLWISNNILQPQDLTVKQIVSAHSLVLYEGKPGKPLHKVFAKGYEYVI